VAGHPPSLLGPKIAEGPVGVIGSVGETWQSMYFGVVDVQTAMRTRGAVAAWERDGMAFLNSLMFPSPSSRYGSGGGGGGWVMYVPPYKDPFMVRAMPTVVVTASREEGETWDPISNTRILQLDPRIRKHVLALINIVEHQLGIRLRVAQGFRTREEQRQLYQIYLGGGPLAAMPGRSYHEYGLAVDLLDVTNGVIGPPNGEPVGMIGESLGFRWGGRWIDKRDYPHFEMSFGQSFDYLIQNWRKSW